MATTVTRKGNLIHVAFAATLENFDIADKMPDLAGQEIKVKSIEMIPNATNDILIVRDTEDSNQTSIKIFDKTAEDAYDNYIKYFNGGEGAFFQPAVNAAEVTAGVEMIIEIAG